MKSVRFTGDGAQFFSMFLASALTSMTEGEELEITLPDEGITFH